MMPWIGRWRPKVACGQICLEYCEVSKLNFRITPTGREKSTMTPTTIPNPHFFLWYLKSGLYEPFSTHPPVLFPIPIHSIVLTNLSSPQSFPEYNRSYLSHRSFSHTESSFRTRAKKYHSLCPIRSTVTSHSSCLVSKDPHRTILRK